MMQPVGQPLLIVHENSYTLVYGQSVTVVERSITSLFFTALPLYLINGGLLTISHTVHNYKTV